MPPRNECQRTKKKGNAKKCHPLFHCQQLIFHIFQAFKGSLSLCDLVRRLGHGAYNTKPTVFLYFWSLIWPGMSLEVGVHEPLCAERPGQNFTDNNVQRWKKTAKRRLNSNLWACRRTQEFVKEVESTAETVRAKIWNKRQKTLTSNQRSVCHARVFTVHCTHGALYTVIRATGGKRCCSPDCRFQSPRPVIYMQIDSVMWASCYY